MINQSMAGSCIFFFFVALLAATAAHAQDRSKLSLDYYMKTCPAAQQIIRTEMECAVRANSRNAAFLIRLHFHDCFVQVREHSHSSITIHRHKCIN